MSDQQQTPGMGRSASTPSDTPPSGTRTGRPDEDATVPLFTAPTSAQPASGLHVDARRGGWRQPTQQQPVLRREGPSASTIVFGALLVLMGGIGVAVTFHAPISTVFGAVDWSVALAYVLALFGVVLIVLAVIWALTGALRSRRAKTGRVAGDAGTDRDDAADAQGR